jgi:hypothetical protein
LENLKRFVIVKEERGVEELSNMKKRGDRVLLSVLVLLSDDITRG